jgi:hypothetical protein
MSYDRASSATTEGTDFGNSARNSLYSVNMRFVPWILLAGVRCSSYGDTASDAGTDGGVTTSSDSGDRPAPTTVFYVSVEGGSDANDGRTPSKPMKTLGNALGQNIAGAELRVCRGTYEEPNLVLRTSTAVRGGYNCATWERGPGFGKKGGFTDTNNDTVLRGSVNSDVAATVRVEGQGASDVLLEGLTILAPPKPSIETNAVLLGDGAVLSLEDTRIKGVPSGATATTRGVFAVGMSTLKIKRSEIDGGGGVSQTQVGSFGVQVFDTALTVEDSTVSSGNGTGPFAAFAVHIVKARGTVRLTNNTLILGNSLRISTTQGTAAVALSTDIADSLQVEGNLIRGTTSRCENQRCGTLGISFNRVNRATLSGNWIAPGLVQSSNSTTAVVGMGIYRSGEVRSFNNVIVMERPPADGNDAQGLQYYDTGGLIAHNTVVVLSSDLGGGSSIAGYAQNPKPGLRIANNLFATFGMGAVAAVFACTSTEPGVTNSEPLTFQNNALVGGRPNTVTSWSQTTGTCTQWGDLGNFGSFNGFGPSTTGNSKLAAVPLEGAASDWLTQTKTKTLKLGTGTAACVVAKKGLALPEVATDISGKPRSSTAPTLGALESDAMCP